MRPTLLYIISEVVIPAKAGIQFKNTGFRVKPGMTNKVKGLLTHYNRFENKVLEAFKKFGLGGDGIGERFIS
jgi:hypothetical protein